MTSRKQKAIDKALARALKKMSKSGLAIKEENSAVLEQVLDYVNGRAETWVMSLPEVFAVSKDAETRLEDARVPKRERAGARCEFHPSGPAANSYRYSVRSTSIRALRRSGGWYLVAAQAISLRPKTPKRMTMMPTETQIAIMQKKIVELFVKG